MSTAEFSRSKEGATYLQTEEASIWLEGYALKAWYIQIDEYLDEYWFNGVLKIIICKSKTLVIISSFWPFMWMASLLQVVRQML